MTTLRFILSTSTSILATLVASVQAFNGITAGMQVDRRRLQVEELFVEDLRGMLTQIGRLDLLEDFGNQAMSYLATADANDVSPEGLEGKTQVLTQIGYFDHDRLRQR